MGLASSDSRLSTGGLLMGTVGLALGEARGAVAGFFYGVHQLDDRDGGGIEEDRRLAACEIDFDFVNTGVAQQGFLDRLLALVAVHAFNLDQCELILADIPCHHLDLLCKRPATSL